METSAYGEDEIGEYVTTNAVLSVMDPYWDLFNREIEVLVFQGGEQPGHMGR